MSITPEKPDKRDDKKKKKEDPTFLTRRDSTGSIQSIPGRGVTAHTDRRARFETGVSISRDANPGELNMNHPTILKLFDETLDPKDPFWLNIGLRQDQLITMLNRGKIPLNYTFSQLVTAIARIKIVED